MDLSSEDLRTLQLGPVWVLSALAGSYSRFDPEELAAFWDTVVAVTLRTPQPARDLLISTTTDRTGLLLTFELDDRPVVSGLSHVVRVLDRIGPPTGTDFRMALVRIALELGRIRGPYGRKPTPQDEQMILLIAALLDVDSVPGLAALV